MVSSRGHQMLCPVEGHGCSTDTGQGERGRGSAGSRGSWIPFGTHDGEWADTPSVNVGPGLEQCVFPLPFACAAGHGLDDVRSSLALKGPALHCAGSWSTVIVCDREPGE